MIDMELVGNCPACGNPIYAPEDPDFSGQPVVRRTCACMPLTAPMWAQPYTVGMPHNPFPLSPPVTPPLTPYVHPPNVCTSGGAAGSREHQQAW